MHLVSGSNSPGFALLLLLLVPMLAADCSEISGRDWCSAIVVRPDQRFRSPGTCDPLWSEEEIAASADVVLIGDFNDVATPVQPAPGRGCLQNPSHPANLAYVQRLRAASIDAERDLDIVHMSRFDLVPATLAAQPQFRAPMLLRTTRPFSTVESFFSADTSPACAQGCRWSDSWSGKEGNDLGTRLRDRVDQRGGPGWYESSVLYMARPDGTGVYWPVAALADSRNANYRAWRVEEAQRAILAGGYDAVELNQKLHYYRAHHHWIGPGGLLTVTGLNFLADTYWTAEPTGFGYSEYVQGWHAQALDLRDGGVPFSVTLPLKAFVSDDFDDTSTASVNEAVLLREVAAMSRILLVDRPASEVLRFETALQPYAVSGKRIVPFDQACGLREP